MENLRAYLDAHEARHLDELFSLLRIPSISSSPAHAGDLLRTAELWSELLTEAGAEKVEIIPTPGNPIVFAERHVADDAPTVLVYGHYDVMPVEPLELWNSEPFEPVVRDGRIWGRGADDDKGQSFIQVKAFEYLVRHDLLRHNIKFILEGEEEIGSPNLAAFLQ